MKIEFSLSWYILSMKNNVKQKVDGEEWRYVPGEPTLLFLWSHGPVLPLPFSLYYYVSA